MMNMASHPLDNNAFSPVLLTTPGPEPEYIPEFQDFDPDDIGRWGYFLDKIGKLQRQLDLFETTKSGELKRIEMAYEEEMRPIKRDFMHLKQLLTVKLRASRFHHPGAHKKPIYHMNLYPHLAELKIHIDREAVEKAPDFKDATPIYAKAGYKKEEEIEIDWARLKKEVSDRLEEGAYEKVDDKVVDKETGEALPGIRIANREQEMQIIVKGDLL